MDVKIINLEPMRVAFIRHVGPYNECGKTWDVLTTHLGSSGWMGADTKMIGLCHDDPEVTPQTKIRYDACLTVNDDFKPHGGISVQTITGGDFARTTHFGPYTRLGETYARFLGQWLPQSGRELRSLPCLEIYMNDPEGTEPEDLITDLYAPLAAL